MTSLTVLDFAAKSGALLTTGFVAQALWRRPSAAQRSVLWLAAFLALALLPLSLLVPPLWRLAPPELTTAQTVAATRYLMAADAVEAEVAGSAAVAEIAPSALPRSSSTQALTGLWLAGVLLPLFQRLAGTWRIHTLLRASNEVAAELQERVHEIAASLGIRRRIKLRLSNSLQVPVTWGTWRAVVVLPAEAVAWPARDLTAALLHELAHIRHHDAACRWLATFLCALHWPNPLVWFAARHWRLLQEQAADDVVLSRGLSAKAYAAQLLRLARNMSPASQFHAPVLAMARRSSLEKRLRSVVAEHCNRRSANGAVTGAAMATAAVMVFMLGSISLQAEADPMPATPSAVSAAAEEGPLILIEMRFVEMAAGDIPESIADLFGTAVPEERLNPILGTWLAKNQAQMTSYPRMVTINEREVVFRSVVHVPVPEAEPLEVGTKATVLPVLRGDVIELSVDINISKSVGESNGLPILSQKSITTSFAVPNRSTALYRLPEAGRSREGSGPAADVICMIRAEHIQSRALSEGSWPFHKTRISRVHFKQATLGEAVEFLRVKGGQDQKIANIVTVGPQPKERLSLDLTDASLHDVLSQVAQECGLQLSYQANAAVLSPSTAAVRRLGWQQKDSQAPAAIAAASLFYPRMKLEDAPLVDALSFLRAEIRRYSSAGSGFEVVLRSGEKVGLNKVTFELCNTSFLDLLHHIATLSGCTLTAEANTLVLTPVE
jgi:beta-lactamase regulating signal transducer with metallopeptidase domain